MKILSLALCLALLILPSCRKSNREAKRVPLEITYSQHEVIYEGLSPTNIPPYVRAPTEPAVFMVPDGTRLLSAGKPVTSSDSEPIIGSLDLITDGDKDPGEGHYVELLDGPQWVQIDLGRSATMSAICLWHEHSPYRIYHDVVVRVSNDPDFRSGVTTLFNNDGDASSGLGAGSDSPYAESRFGLIVDGRGVQGRYVRLHSNGNASSIRNRYIEVEVHGLP